VFFSSKISKKYLFLKIFFQYFPQTQSSPSTYPVMTKI